MPTEMNFVERGTLPRPGPIGRLVRMGFGLWILYFVYVLVRAGAQLVGWTPPANLSWWLGMLIGLWVVSEVVNIGWGREWGRRPQIALLAIAVALWLVGFVGYEATWSPALGAFIWVAMLYIYGHLGLSFVLAATLGTPGCEMRALPHLWTVLTGRETAEHYCPGMIDTVDRWEVRLTGRDA